jgi:hypothetical protein
MPIFPVVCLQLVLSAKQDLVEEAAALVENSAAKSKAAAKKGGASGARKPKKRKEPGSEDDVSEAKENSRKKVKAGRNGAKGKGKVSKKDVGSEEEDEEEDEDDEEGSEADSEDSDAPKKRGAKSIKGEFPSASTSHVRAVMGLHVI